MFFAKALGGAMVAVFGGLYVAGFFDHEQGVLDAVETVRQAEIADNKDARWGPHCDGIRDKALGFEGGEPAPDRAAAPASGLAAIATVHAMARTLEEAGCDPDAAPGAFSPFEPEKGRFREVESLMEGGPVDDSGWGGDPNAYNANGPGNGDGSDWGASR